MSRNANRLTCQLAWWCFLSVGTTVGGCARAPAPPPKMPAIAVTVAEPIRQDVTDYLEFTGRTAAVQSVDLLARVTGYLRDPRDLSPEERKLLEATGCIVPWKTGGPVDKDKYLLFEEGATVQKGQLLFLIDPRPYQAQYDQAVSQVALREANRDFTQTELKRNKPLAEKAAISAAEFDKYVASAKEAVAAVEASKSALEGLELNLQFTRVTAPITGRVGAAQVTPGNLVAADKTLLTTVQSVNPIHAYFDVDELTVLRLKQLVEEGKVKSQKDSPDLPVKLTLADGTEYPHAGVVDFADSKLDASTGTIKVRAVFPNPTTKQGQHLLLASQFVRVRIPLGDPQSSLLVAEQAIGSEQGRKYMWVVGADHKVEDKRFVSLGRLERGLRVVESGLQGGERVVVEGIQRVRKGRDVTPESKPMQQFATGPATPAAKPPAANRPAGSTATPAAPQKTPEAQ